MLAISFIMNKNAFPVGCVPSTAVAVSGVALPRGDVSPGGLPRRGQWCLPGGVSARRGGVCQWCLSDPPCEQNDRRL